MEKCHGSSVNILIKDNLTEIKYEGEIEYFKLLPQTLAM
jgi:hypothetical protein